MEELGTLTIGCSRDAECRAMAEDAAAAWTRRGGTVLSIVDWPETAASWLRQARRFVEGGPDAWLVVARPAGWARMRERLLHSTTWDPARTLAVHPGD
ncbi:hypothetical protein [Amycolatopsis albispora]|uniref:Uncharacterized protein n=1 Tax=Amycolatopsis albispora TaxID=1804986 RepID=A0A344L9E5_9PSEU|nr:hypothetical protein [Amycolatopsis albispora]AXB44669.1 hypothetical protein A4R43_20970 [Amycolatopsis albispora]